MTKRLGSFSKMLRPSGCEIKSASELRPNPLVWSYHNYYSKDKKRAEEGKVHLIFVLDNIMADSHHYFVSILVYPSFSFCHSSLSHTHTHTHTYIRTLSLSLSLTHTHTHIYIRTLSLSLSLSLSLPRFVAGQIPVKTFVVTSLRSIAKHKRLPDVLWDTSGRHCTF